MGRAVKNKVTAKIDYDKFKKLIGSRTVKEFYEEVKETWELDIAYKSFMSLLTNDNQWLLTYAYAVSEQLNVPVEELFFLERME